MPKQDQSQVLADNDTPYSSIYSGFEKTWNVDFLSRCHVHDENRCSAATLGTWSPFEDMGSISLPLAAVAKVVEKGEEGKTRYWTHSTLPRLASSRVV